MEIQNLSKEERHRIILKHLSKRNFIKVKDLSEKLGVSMETIRQDLSYLESELKLRKVHGGAMLMKEPGLELYFSKRVCHNAAAKNAMAQKSVEFVTTGDTIGIGSGTTLLQMANLLETVKGITVVTSSIPVLNRLAEFKQLGNFDGEIYFIGGKVNVNLLSTSGSLTEKMFRDIYLDKCFFSCDALSPEGIFAHSSNEALLTQLYLKHAAKAILLVDSSKMNQQNFIKITNWSKIDTVITDGKCSKKYEEIVQEFGVEWVEVRKPKIE